MNNKQKDTAELQNEIENTTNIDAFMKNRPDTLPAHNLAEYLQLLLEQKGLKKSDIIKQSGLEKTYAYHIFSGEKSPTRPKVLAIALAMKLTREETDYLLYYAGANRLYARDSFDAVIIFALKNHLSVEDTNIQLERLGETIFLL